MHDRSDFETKSGLGLRDTSSHSVCVLFGTRPEVIKLAPVIKELRTRGWQTTVVSSGQHLSLLQPFLDLLEIEVDHDLAVMKEDQGPNDVCSAVVSRFDAVLKQVEPDVVLVQGDTTTTLAGALAAFNRKVPVGHVEAGLRTGDPTSPFPEEMNRRVTTQVATFHFAATEGNRTNLLNEGVSPDSVYVTGNTVVDALGEISKMQPDDEPLLTVLGSTSGLKRIVLTTHRRENFGEVMSGYLTELRGFVEENPDTCLLFPMHPNPNVRRATQEILGQIERVFLLDPLDYKNFVALMRSAWVIVSDSGGVQEEAPSLGKPLLVIRNTTERPEAISSGVAKLVGTEPGALAKHLRECSVGGKWVDSVASVPNPFGDGMASKRIVDALESVLVQLKNPEQ